MEELNKGYLDFELPASIANVGEEDKESKRRK
jgi:hypothetical protein